LRGDDLDRLGWAGGPLLLQEIRAEWVRAQAGEVDYVVMRMPSGRPIAKGAADYRHEHGPGRLYQLSTHPELRGLGIGTRVIGALEERIARRGVGAAWLGVEVSNDRAHALYRRLGYEPFAVVEDSWDQQDADGRIYRYETELTLMRKELRPSGPVAVDNAP
jgi:ribosomal protein S18 acetylase RimI-like enzyme